MARVLIIEDDEALRRLIGVGLMQAGHISEEASDGAEGVRVYEQGRQDVVLCDIMMPNKEGLETIRELKRKFPSIKIIAMSGGLGVGAMNPLQIAIRFGAVKSLQKPFSMDELNRVVDEVLESSI